MPHSPINSGPDDIEAHPRHTGHRWFDLILALSAIFISAVSLAVAIEHGRTERDLVAASSWPFLREVRSNEYSSENGVVTAAIGVSNGGVGPAKLESFEVLYKGAPTASSLDLLRRCCGLGPSADDAKQQLPTGIHYEIADRTVLRAGEVAEVLGVHRNSPVGERFAEQISAAPTDITVRACSCSILDQCWTSTLRDTRVTPIKACPEPRQRFDPNGP